MGAFNDGPAQPSRRPIISISGLGASSPFRRSPEPFWRLSHFELRLEHVIDNKTNSDLKKLSRKRNASGGVMPSQISEASAPLIRFDKIVKRFGGVTAVKDVSLSVRQGEILAL